MDFEKTLPLRYYINLGRRQDRRIETEIALMQAGITAERFPAIDARHVRRTGGYESAGRYALALSQRLVLRKASLRKADAVLVLEDDVVFDPDLLKKLERIDLPEDWGIFYLGCAHRHRPEPAGPGLVKVRYALDTHAFAVRAPYYRAVMKSLAARSGEDAGHPLASDWFLADLHESIPTYACYPNLAWQAEQGSDLTGYTYSNYTDGGEQLASALEVAGLQGELWGVKPWPRPGNGEGGAAIEERETGREALAEPRLGLLFLTRGEVNHPEIWEEFVQSAGDGIRVFSHVKEREEPLSFLKGTTIGEWHETEWGDISLVRAMLSLLKEALADRSLTHFAFVSESCIPIRPWSEIRRRLTFDPRSMIDWQDRESMKVKHLERLSPLEDVPARERRMHSQWCLLDREAALCVTERDLTDRFEKVKAADEHYLGTVLALRGFPEEKKINRRQVTWTLWNDFALTSRPEEHRLTRPELIAELANFEGFFARKFPKESDIAKWGLHRETPSSGG